MGLTAVGAADPGDSGLKSDEWYNPQGGVGGNSGSNYAVGNLQNAGTYNQTQSLGQGGYSAVWTGPYQVPMPQYYAVPLAAKYTLALAVIATKGASVALKKQAEVVIAEGFK